MRPGRFAILERRDIKYRGSTAEYIHFRKETEHSLTSEGEMLVVHRAPKGIGPSFYVVMLRTGPLNFTVETMPSIFKSETG